MPEQRVSIQSEAALLDADLTPYQRLTNMVRVSGDSHNTLELPPFRDDLHDVTCVASHILHDSSLLTDSLTHDDGLVSRRRTYPSLVAEAHYVALNDEREQSLLYSLSVPFTAADEVVEKPFQATALEVLRDPEQRSHRIAGKPYNDNQVIEGDNPVFAAYMAEDPKILLTKHTKLECKTDGRKSTLVEPPVLGYTLGVYGLTRTLFNYGTYLRVRQDRVEHFPAENSQFVSMVVSPEDMFVVHRVDKREDERIERGEDGRLYIAGQGDDREVNLSIPHADFLNKYGSAGLFKLMWTEITQEFLGDMRVPLLGALALDPSASFAGVQAQARKAVQTFMRQGVMPRAKRIAEVSDIIREVDEAWPLASRPGNYINRPKNEFTLKSIADMAE